MEGGVNMRCAGVGSRFSTEGDGNIEVCLLAGLLRRVEVAMNVLLVFAGFKLGKESICLILLDIYVPQ